MKTLYPHDSILLLPGQCLSFRSEQALWLRADLGRLWLTGRDIADDIWLQEGESAILLPNPHLVVQADAVLARMDALSPQTLHNSSRHRVPQLPPALLCNQRIASNAGLFPYILRREASYNALPDMQAAPAGLPAT